MFGNLHRRGEVSTQTDDAKNGNAVRDACVECHLERDKPTYLALHCIIYKAHQVAKVSDIKDAAQQNQDFREALIYVANDVLFCDARQTMLRLLQLDVPDNLIDVLVQVRGWLPRSIDELGDSVNNQRETIETVIGGLESELLFHFILLANDVNSKHVEHRRTRNRDRLQRKMTISKVEPFKDKSQQSCRPGNGKIPILADSKSYPRQAKEFESLADLDVDTFPRFTSANRYNVSIALTALWRFLPQTVISRMCANALTNREISTLLKRDTPSPLTISQRRLDAFAKWYRAFLADPSRYLADIPKYRSVSAGKVSGPASQSEMAIDFNSCEASGENGSTFYADTDADKLSASKYDSDIEHFDQDGVETSRSSSLVQAPESMCS